MKQQLVLRILAETMEWTDEQAASEFSWLRLMSRLKYDAYQGYLAGVRFVESLVVWLQQFDPKDRRVAYEFVRHRLAFVSTAEMRHLVANFYPRVIQPALVRSAAAEFNIDRHLVWADERAEKWVARALRRTLFVGLSDGARMDVMRRVNGGRISNEQTVLAPLIDDDKWRDLRKELIKDLGDEDGAPTFDCVWVIDDFIGSGTTLIRRDPKTKEWKGKLSVLNRALGLARQRLGKEFPVASTFTLRVHHYIATEQSLGDIAERCAQAREDHGDDEWFSDVHFSHGMLLPKEFKLSRESDPFVELTDRYYDAKLENRHAEQSGVANMRLGYKECALPLVLEHNTPNNAVSLLWAETAGNKGAHPMRPLFRRVTRHS